MNQKENRDKMDNKQVDSNCDDTKSTQNHVITHTNESHSRKRSKPPKKSSDPVSLWTKLGHMLRLSGGLLFYLSLRRVSELSVTWEFPPVYLTRLSFRPMFARMGFTISTYSAQVSYSLL